ncbi:AcrR family transcriptional regulator [Actinoplanes lutulentus]|uniref:TetR family transcriptional regulator n=1 Tax=Actinoplanes lutulentus TaxID=1287878 RepID=A0A327ZAF9_9ACTN|nr:TetR/AcrR family transcriptional regulator [Actinoplanes lutulentus]MBB2946680.1 AcrR family transcriptional regulator [Actinoplanes lutulentus]RAK35573.1 TetR family transcriptional regulator [Actinoplanes lutulentus]
METAPDRRAALKARHRRAILDAAKDLVSEGQRFSVDQLAERADVSRRTIFNHFTSIDDVVTTVCSETLGVVIEHFRQVVTAGSEGPGTRADAFATLTEALRATDIPGLITFLWRALGGFDKGDPRPRQIFQATFSRTSADLARELSVRNAGLDPLEAELLVSALMHGTEVIAEHWLAATSAATDEAARTLWRELLERMIESVRTGY